MSGMTARRYLPHMGSSGTFPAAYGCYGVPILENAIMKTYFSGLAVALALTAGAASFPAAAASDRAQLLRDADVTVTNLKHDPSFDQARKMIQGARAVYIVPKLVKGGFIFGAEG